MLHIPQGLALLKKGEAWRRNPDNRLPVHTFRGDKSTIVGILPDWESGARRAPRIHHFFVRSVADRQPLKQIENEGFHRIGHVALF